MHCLGDRHFVEIPGNRTHELPPLLLRVPPRSKRLDRAVKMAESLIEEEEIIPALPSEDPQFSMLIEQRRLDLALNLVEQYLGLVEHWRLGDSILEWSRQCETTFESRQDLRPLLRPDVWPHAGRASFVTLIRDKAVDTRGVEPEQAVGVRLSFRQPPPLECCTDQFLFYLRTTLADAAYRTWAQLTPEPVSSLPPERFSFQVVDMDV
jgi:hypothetical protein